MEEDNSVDLWPSQIHTGTHTCTHTHQTNKVVLAIAKYLFLLISELVSTEWDSSEAGCEGNRGIFLANVGIGDSSCLMGHAVSILGPSCFFSSSGTGSCYVAQDDL